MQKSSNDLIVYLDICDELLLKRTKLRDVDFNNAKNMKLKTQRIEELQTEFFVRYNTDMELFTIRHYDKQSIINTIQNREIVLEQKNRTTVQYVLKSNVNSSWNVIEREKK